MRFLSTLILVALGLYQRLLSPVLSALFHPHGWGCRFHPTCSCYALQAVARFGPLKGLWMSTRRLCRCHPWGASGIDLVPDGPGSVHSTSKPTSITPRTH